MKTSNLVKLLVSVEAKQPETFSFDPPREVAGYYQTFGVTACDDAQMLLLIQDYLTQDLGSTFINVSERWVPDFDGADADIREDVGDLESVGLWYWSGRAWFSPDE